jgi:ATP-dependent DNA ligase
MTRFVPMLASPVDIDDLPELIQDGNWAFDQKLDGQRRLVAVTDGQPQAVGRRGATAKLPREIQHDLAVLGRGDWLVDGELIGTALWVFDLIRAPNDRINEQTPFAIRRRALDGIAAHISTGTVHVLPSFATAAEKQVLVDQVRDSGCEGVVARHVDGRYEFGKRSQNMRKAKFFRDIDVVVTRLRVDGRENFGIGLVRGGELIEIGTCSALYRSIGNVEVGQVVTVRYLYANERGHLQHPSQPQLRTDKLPEECTFDQLIYRSPSIVNGLG